MKKAVLLLVTVGAVIIASSLTPLGPNLGWHRGYYGRLNRMVARVKAIPGVTVRGVRANYDVTVEEFTIDVLLHDQDRASIHFPELPDARLIAIVERWEADMCAAGRL